MSDKPDDIFDYQIPDEIKSRIPEYFYYAFGGEIVSLYGRDALIEQDLLGGDSPMEYDTSTGGWVTALQATCKKLNMDWLMDYWHSLPWYHSDVFDYELAEETMKRFKNAPRANPYYLYLYEQEKQ